MEPDNKKVDVLILATEPFPYGEAATNRIISYAKVLAEDLKVRYVSISPDWSCNPANLSKGIHEGIEYVYAPGSSEWNPLWPKWKKAVRLLNGRIKTLKKIIEYNPDTVILVSRNISLTKWLLWISRIRKFRFIIERTELTALKDKKYGHKLLSLHSKSNGILCISREILEYLKPSVGGSVDLFHLPMSVDFDRFPEISGDLQERYFAMCSGNNWERDGAIDSINAFLEFRKEHPEYTLKIAGILNEKTEYSRKFKQIVKSNSDNGVVYLGRLSSDRIPAFIMEAAAAVLTPHKDYESGGFPTKLGEYLASGVPVICTSVSEIPIYLDRSNSFICPPSDVASIVESMRLIAVHPEKAAAVGRKGREIAKHVFNVSTYKKELIEFIKGNGKH